MKFQIRPYDTSLNLHPNVELRERHVVIRSGPNFATVVRAQDGSPLEYEVVGKPEGPVDAPLSEGDTRSIDARIRDYKEALAVLEKAKSGAKPSEPV